MHPTGWPVTNTEPALAADSPEWLLWLVFVGEPLSAQLSWTEQEERL